jgi:hypothetical protein
MVRSTFGIVHGRTIELESDLGIREGEKVEVYVRPLVGKKTLPGPPPGWLPGSAESAAGMVADCWSDEDDRVLEKVHEGRKRSDRRELFE